MSNKDCIFCNTPDAEDCQPKLDYPDFDGKIFNCPICGKFMITDTQLVCLAHPKYLQAKEELRIAQLLAERQLTDKSRFWIIVDDGPMCDKPDNFYVENSLINRYPDCWRERLDRSLKNLSLLKSSKNGTIDFPTDHAFTDSRFLNTANYIANLKSEGEKRRLERYRQILLLFSDLKNYQITLERLVQEGWLRKSDSSNYNVARYIITDKTWEYLEQGNKPMTENNASEKTGDTFNYNYNTTVTGNNNITASSVIDSKINQQSYEINVKSGDIDSLAEYLRTLKLPEDEISLLRNAIEEDKRNNQPGLGCNVSNWLDVLKQNILAGIIGGFSYDLVCQAVCMFYGIANVLSNMVS